MNNETIAHSIARIFGDDGMCFRDESGRSLEVVCLEHNAVKEEKNADLVRYFFSDGSAIVISCNAWDIEGPEEWSWLGS